MKILFNKFVNLCKDDSAQGMAEYGLLLFLIVVACVAVATTLGGDFKKKLQEASSAIAGANHK